MVPALIVGEVRRFVRTPGVLLALVGLCGAAWLGIRLGQRDLGEQQRTYAEQLQSRIQVQIRYPSRVTGRGPEPGLRVLRPPNPAAMLIQGQDRTLPAAWEMTPAGPEAQPSYTSAGRRLEGGGTWDLDILVRFVGGILALGLGLTSVLTDRSSGWVKVLATAPVAESVTSWTRIVGGLVTISGVTATLWFVIWLSLISGPAPISFPRFLSLAPPVLAYLGIFLGVGLVCAWRSRSALRAIFYGVAIWLTAGVMGPPLTSLTTEFVEPAPARAHFEQERHDQYADVLREIDQEFARLVSTSLDQAMSSQQLDELGTAEAKRLDQDWQGRMLRARASVEALETAWQSRQSARHRLIGWLSWLSPGALVRTTMSELAGTGTGAERSWEWAVEQYEHKLNRAVFDNLPSVTLAIPVGQTGFMLTNPRHPAPKFGDVPAFEPPDTSWQMRLWQAGPSMAGLSGWLIAAIACAWFAGSRLSRSPHYESGSSSVGTSSY